MFALGSWKTFINNCSEDSVARNQMETKTRLATAALLVRVATVDSDMSDTRAKELRRILRSRFRLDDSSATQLIGMPMRPNAARSIFTNSRAYSMKLSTTRAAAKSFK